MRGFFPYIDCHSIFCFKAQLCCLALVVIEWFYLQRLQGNLELKGKAIRTLAVAGVATGSVIKHVNYLFTPGSPLINKTY